MVISIGRKVYRYMGYKCSLKCNSDLDLGKLYCQSCVNCLLKEIKVYLVGKNLYCLGSTVLSM